MIRTGASRLVVLLGPLALKFPRPWPWRGTLLGLLANLQERDFARLRHPLLCPVLFALPGGWLVVMRRARPLTDQEFAALRPGDWGGVLAVVEFKRSSFGVLAGRVVGVDYG